MLFSIKESSAKDMIKSLEDTHQGMKTLPPEANTDLHVLLEQWGLDMDDDARMSIVHTQYHPVEKLTNGLVIKWWNNK